MRGQALQKQALTSTTQILIEWWNTSTRYSNPLSPPPICMPSQKSNPTADIYIIHAVLSVS